MKGFVSFALVLLLSMGYRGCSAPPTYRDENFSFSYEADLSDYAEDGPQILRNGFVNTEELAEAINTDLDAVERAMREYTLPNVSPYYRVFFDPTTNVWKVVFNYYDESLEKQAVYMTEKGKTLLIVYMEADFPEAQTEPAVSAGWRIDT